MGSGEEISGTFQWWCADPWASPPAAGLFPVLLCTCWSAWATAAQVGPGLSPLDALCLIFLIHEWGLIGTVVPTSESPAGVTDTARCSLCVGTPTYTNLLLVYVCFYWGETHIN